MNAAQKELRILREEEKVLENISDKLRDQLHRLKVEELALLSELRQQQGPEEKEPNTAILNTELQHDGASTSDVNTSATLNLSVDQLVEMKVEGEEEEEEEDEEEEEMSVQDELTAFMNQLQQSLN